jgi:hypothetical protein
MEEKGPTYRDNRDPVVGAGARRPAVEDVDTFATLREGRRSGRVARGGHRGGENAGESRSDGGEKRELDHFGGLNEEFWRMREMLLNGLRDRKVELVICPGDGLGSCEEAGKSSPFIHLSRGSSLPSPECLIMISYSHLRRW